MSRQARGGRLPDVIPDGAAFKILVLPLLMLARRENTKSDPIEGKPAEATKNH
ncbi:MAG: hypothetical protein ABR530_03960 [Pyrinomonadaceae bacterium]